MVVAVLVVEEGNRFDFADRLVVSAGMGGIIAASSGGSTSDNGLHGYCAMRPCSEKLLSLARQRCFGGGRGLASICLRFSGRDMSACCGYRFAPDCSTKLPRLRLMVRTCRHGGGAGGLSSCIESAGMQAVGRAYRT